MKTHAYGEEIIEYSMDNLGVAFDYAVNCLDLKGSDFYMYFDNSGLAKEFAYGNPKYIVGMSGKELADRVFESVGLGFDEKGSKYEPDYTSEYWCGWILAYYQWESGISFKKLRGVLTYEILENLYGVLHEASKQKAYQVLNDIVRSESFLQRMRKKRNLTQSELAKKSGVSLRSIQLYEQKQNDINKAQYNNLKNLADSLHCEIEDILE